MFFQNCLIVSQAEPCESMFHDDGITSTTLIKLNSENNRLQCACCCTCSIFYTIGGTPLPHAISDMDKITTFDDLEDHLEDQDHQK